MRLSTIALFFLLLLILPAKAIGKAEFEESDCNFDKPANVEINCGYLIVPENRNDPDSKAIRLHVAILRNPSDNIMPDPIIYLEGGPGGSALKYLSYTFQDRYKPLFATSRDIIVFDQRGTGLSEPALNCPDYISLRIELADYEQDGEAISHEEIGVRYHESLLDCANQISSEHALEGYNTIQNAADVEDLRVALGYDEVNLWGISYGTRLALGVMRDFPEHVRSVVIDSVYTPDSNLYTSNPANFDRALTVLFETCEADDACNELYPDLRDVFFATATALNEEPVTFDAPNPLTGRSYENVVLDGYGFVNIIFRLLYDTNALVALPELIYDASNGEYPGIALMMGATFSQSDDFSNGMYYAVQCNEEISFTHREDLESAWEYYAPLGEFANPLNNSINTFDICAAIDSGEAPASENKAIRSDIPTLVTTGEFDPVTPPQWGALAAETLSNNAYINFPYTGHGATAIEGCAQDILIEFFINPEPAALDTSCIDEMSMSFTGTRDFEGDFVPLDMSELGIDARTIVPASWEEREDIPGFYMRGDSSLDLTLIQIEIVPRVADAEALAERFQNTLEIDFEELETYEAEYSDWNVYPIIVFETEGKLAISIIENIAVVILMLGDKDIYEAVLLPMLDAFELEA